MRSARRPLRSIERFLVLVLVGFITIDLLLVVPTFASELRLDRLHPSLPIVNMRPLAAGRARIADGLGEEFVAPVQRIAGKLEQAGVKTFNSILHKVDAVSRDPVGPAEAPVDSGSLNGDEVVIAIGPSPTQKQSYTPTSTAINNQPYPSMTPSQLAVLAATLAHTAVQTASPTPVWQSSPVPTLGPSFTPTSVPSNTPLPMAPAPTSASPNGQYYVAPGGDDSNPGTQAQPWQSIQKANQSLMPGDTVHIRGGTYAESIEPFRSGEPGSPITYRNFGNEAAIITGNHPGDPAVAIGWPLKGPGGPDSYIVVEGITIVRSDSPTNNVEFVDILIDGQDSLNNVVRSCAIRAEGSGGLSEMQAGTRETGILVASARGTLIEGNTIEGIGKIGIWLVDLPKYTIIRGNHISHTGMSSINLSDTSGEIAGTLIEGNILEWSEIEDGIQFEIDYDDPQAIRNLGAIIRNNVIRNNAENAIDLKGAGNIVIEGNFIYGNRGDNDGPLDGNDRDGNLGGVMRGNGTHSRDVIIRNNIFFDNFGAILLDDGYKVYNNTIIGNNRDFEGPNSSWTTDWRPQFVAILGFLGSSDTSILNNIIVGHSHGEVAFNHSTGSNLSIDHNLYWPEDGLRLVDYRDRNDWDALTFEDWQGRLNASGNVIGGDANSLVENPAFNSASVSPTGPHDQYDFSLESNSPAIDAGTYLTVTVGSGSGSTVVVRDAGYFHDGFGVIEGDMINIGANQPVRVVAINYSANSITLAHGISWDEGAEVSLPFHGSHPDIGAQELHPSREFCDHRSGPSNSWCLWIPFVGKQ